MAQLRFTERRRGRWFDACLGAMGILLIWWSVGWDWSIWQKIGFAVGLALFVTAATWKEGV